MTNREIRLVVHDYIGVQSGYLGDFSYRTHRDFYPDYCDLEIDPDEFEGTTRARFEHILKTSPPKVQAKILRGVLAKYPPRDDPSRTDLAKKIEAVASRLEGQAIEIAPPAIVSDAAAVRLALEDAEALEAQGKHVSAFDRIHTALHGYLKQECVKAGITFDDDDPTITVLFKALRNQHPRLIENVPYAEERKKLLSSMSAGLDSLGAIRNHGSLAHANENLVRPQEARLAVNYVKAVLHYLEASLR